MVAVNDKIFSNSRLQTVMKFRAFLFTTPPVESKGWEESPFSRAHNYQNVLLSFKNLSPNYTIAVNDTSFSRSNSDKSEV